MVNWPRSPKEKLDPVSNKPRKKNVRYATDALIPTPIYQQGSDVLRNVLHDYVSRGIVWDSTTNIVAELAYLIEEKIVPLPRPSFKLDQRNGCFTAGHVSFIETFDPERARDIARGEWAKVHLHLAKAVASSDLIPFLEEHQKEHQKDLAHKRRVAEEMNRIRQQHYGVGYSSPEVIAERTEDIIRELAEARIEKESKDA